MADIVNLRRERKRRDKAAEAEAARENRVRHGRSLAQKEEDTREARRRAALAEGHLLEGKPEA